MSPRLLRLLSVSVAAIALAFALHLGVGEFATHSTGTDVASAEGDANAHAVVKAPPAPAKLPAPRGAQALLLAAKIRALFEGRFAASVDDVRACALPALRHRVLLNFEGEAEGVKTDEVLQAILKHLPESK